MFYFFLFAMSFVSLKSSDNMSNAANIDLGAFSYFKNLQKPVQIDPKAFAHFRALQNPVSVNPQLTFYSYSYSEPVNNYNKKYFIVETIPSIPGSQMNNIKFYIYKPISDNF